MSSSPLFSCCFVNFYSKPCKVIAVAGTATAILSALAIFAIFNFITGAYIAKAVGLSTGVSKTALAAWLNAAKWSAVAFGGGVGVIAFTKLLDVAILSCKKRKSQMI